MGLLDSVIGGLMGSGGTASPMGGVLSSMLDGSNQAGGMGMGAAGMGSGLSGLMSSFEQGGLGHIAQSWVGNSPNQEVSPQQLQGVLGQDQVQSMAGASRHGAERFPVTTEPAPAKRRAWNDAERPAS